MVPGSRRRDVAHQIVVGLDRAAVDRDDDVVHPQAGTIGGVSRSHVLDERAAVRPELQRALQGRGDVGQRRRRWTRAPRVPCSRNCGSTATTWRSARQSRCSTRATLIAVVMPTTSPRALIERSAAVAETDGRVGLDVGVEAGIEQLPAEIADDADRHRMRVDAERIADRADPLADTQGVGIAQRRDRQAAPFALNMQQRDVDRRIGADDIGAKRAAVIERDRHAIGAGDDVVVREDVTRRGR